MAPGKESWLRAPWQSYSVKADFPPPHCYASPARLPPPAGTAPPLSPVPGGAGCPGSGVRRLSRSPARSGDRQGRGREGSGPDPTRPDPPPRGRPGRARPARPLPPPAPRPSPLPSPRRAAGPEGPHRPVRRPRPAASAYLSSLAVMTPSSLGMRSAALTTSWCPSTLLRRTGRLLCGREWISAAMLPRDRPGAHQLTARGKRGGRRNAACSGAAPPRRAEVPRVAAQPRRRA